MNKNFKVLHISSANTSSGAGIGALNTHIALLRKGINSKILYINDEEISHKIYSYETNIFRKVFRKIITFLDSFMILFYLNKKKQIFSTGFFGIPLYPLKLFKEADIIHLHWINHGFINLNSFKYLKKPVILTMRDMWTFTGGCHYSIDCQKYITHCSKCPILNSNSERDLSFLIFQSKVRNLKNLDIRYVAISSWLKEKAESSFLLRDKLIEINYSGIDSNIFKVYDKKIQRSRFNFNNFDNIVLMGANNLNDIYKGLNYAIQSLNNIADLKILLITFGEECSFDNLRSNIKHQHLGFLSDTMQLARLYSAVDVFLSPSIAESFGKTIAEAQMCGTPVVAFNYGGPSEIVQHKVTGYLAHYKSIDDLTSGIIYALTYAFDNHLISEIAQSKFSIDITAEKYIKSYNQILYEFK